MPSLSLTADHEFARSGAECIAALAAVAACASSRPKRQHDDDDDDDDDDEQDEDDDNGEEELHSAVAMDDGSAACAAAAAACVDEPSSSDGQKAKQRSRKRVSAAAQPGAKSGVLLSMLLQLILLLLCSASEPRHFRRQCVSRVPTSVSAAGREGLAGFSEGLLSIHIFRLSVTHIVAIFTQVYDEDHNLKVNDMVEFVGIFSTDGGFMDVDENFAG